MDFNVLRVQSGPDMLRSYPICSKQGEGMVRLTVAVPQDLLDRVDEFAKRMRDETPGAVQGNRSLAIRALLGKGLADAERKVPKDARR